MQTKFIAQGSVAAAVLAAVGAVIAIDLNSGARLPAPPRASSQAAAPGRTDPGTQQLVADIGAKGARLVIPKLGVNAPLVPTGATGVPGSATLTVPADIRKTVWWDGIVSDSTSTVRMTAPAPGQHGVAVIAGHVDSTAGPGALYKLSQLAPGDTITVTGSDGRPTRWTVTGRPQTALKVALPAALWVTTGPPKLALVTCGGPFDSATGHYLDNVIVWAKPAS